MWRQNAREIAQKAEALRAIIMKGEQTSRDLSVLLANSKQLSAMTAERLQRLPSDRHDLDEEIAKLVTELGEQLAAKMEEKAGMREAILREIPKANLYPKKATAEEMIKQVEAVATFLGREVADYFGRTNETLVALRRAVGLRAWWTGAQQQPANSRTGSSNGGACSGFAGERPHQAPGEAGPAIASRGKGGSGAGQQRA